MLPHAVYDNDCDVLIGTKHVRRSTLDSLDDEILEQIFSKVDGGDFQCAPPCSIHQPQPWIADLAALASAQPRSKDAYACCKMLSTALSLHCKFAFAVTCCLRFSRLSARLYVLPLVSKRWARVMRASTVVWQETCLDAVEIAAYNCWGRRSLVSFDLPGMAAWFQARPGRCEYLGLRTRHSSIQLPSALTPMLLSTQAASLRYLSVDLTACGLRGHELGILAAISGLIALDVRLIGCGLDDRGAAIFRAAETLTALQQLHVGYTADPAKNIRFVPQEKVSLPRCQELNKLRSQSLHTLSVAMSCGTQDATVLQLAGLTNLEECHLFGDGRSSAEFWMDMASFAGCERLGELTLHHHAPLSLLPGCLAALSALTSLTLTDCCLRGLPHDVAPLTALQYLDLSCNENMDIDAAATAALSELKQLRILDVAKAAPAVHSSQSVQILFDLVEACRDAGQQLHVNFEPDLSETFEAETQFWGCISD